MPKLLRLCVRVVAFAAALLVNVEIGQASGALAIGTCGAYGFSYDYPHTRGAAAQTAALAKCTGDCQAVAVQRACAALAIDVRNACGAHGYAISKKLGHAQNTALRECYRYGGKDCVIRAWLCDAKG
jgi:hypothetical protein